MSHPDISVKLVVTGPHRAETSAFGATTITLKACCDYPSPVVVFIDKPEVRHIVQCQTCRDVLARFETAPPGFGT